MFNINNSCGENQLWANSSDFFNLEGCLFNGGGGLKGIKTTDSKTT